MGMGHVSGDHIPGLSAVAAPVLDAFGEAAAAIALVGTSDDIAPCSVEYLRTIAAEAFATLGWRFPVVSSAV